MSTVPACWEGDYDSRFELAIRLNKVRNKYGPIFTFTLNTNKTSHHATYADYYTLGKEHLTWSSGARDLSVVKDRNTLFTRTDGSADGPTV
jgi:hypothetical protein